MTTWNDFELQCTAYLKEHFGKYATFIHQGGSDSTISDILVITNSGKEFYIDVKHCPAQCGQFVLLPNIETKAFMYSSKNTTPINDYSLKIINYMNSDFEYFKEAGSSGKQLLIQNGIDIFANWIIEAYKKKNVCYFITNNFTLFPIERIKDYFNITAKYRVKRSGSKSVGSKNIPSVLEHFTETDYTIINPRIEGSKLFVSSPNELHNKRFILSYYEYMFSKRNSEYEIRQLSNTFNANVIFSVELKTSISGLSTNDFIKLLK